MSRILPEGSSEFLVFFVVWKPLLRGCHSGLVWSGLVLVGLVLLGPVPVGLVPVGLVQVGLVLVGPVPVATKQFLEYRNPWLESTDQ